MRRVKLCCGILLGIVVFSITSLWILNSQCEQIIDQIEVIQTLYENNETAQALEKTDELCRSWEKSYKILSMLVKNDKLSEVNAIMARLRPLIENNSEELTAEFGSAAFQLNLLRRTEFPYFHNIF